MRFVGKETTLKDFPGRLALMCYSRGCQLRCSYCHNTSIGHAPVTSDSLSMGHTVEGTIKEIKERYPVGTGVVLSGGEPTIQPDFSETVREFSRNGIPVALETNGLELPEADIPAILEHVTIGVKWGFEHHLPPDYLDRLIAALEFYEGGHLVIVSRVHPRWGQEPFSQDEEDRMLDKRCWDIMSKVGIIKIAAKGWQWIINKDTFQSSGLLQ